MKKYILVLAGFAFALSLGMASAQNVGATVSGCLEWNQGCIQQGRDDTGQIICLKTGNTTCKRTGTISAGTQQTGTGVYPTTGTTYPNTGAYPQQGGTVGTGGYGYAGQQRQMGSNQVDFSFFTGIIGGVGAIVRMLPPILLGAAVIVFFWSLIKFLWTSADKPEDKKKAQYIMLYSLAAIFIMVTLWGIIAFFGDIIGIRQDVIVTSPTLPR